MMTRRRRMRTRHLDRSTKLRASCGGQTSGPLVHLDLSGDSNFEEEEGLGEKDAKKMTLATREPSASLVFSLLTEFASQECWRSAQRWPTLISTPMGSEQVEQRVLQECFHSARCWHTSISGTIPSALSGKGGFELRGRVKTLPFVCRHLGQLVLCHMFRRRATRKSDMLYTYRVVVFWLPLSLWAKPV